MRAIPATPDRIGMGGPGEHTAHRNPMLLFLFLGLLLFRLDARKFLGLLLFQEPPRNTRARAWEPAGGHYGPRRDIRKTVWADHQAHIEHFPSLRRFAPAAVHGQCGASCAWERGKGIKHQGKITVLARVTRNETRGRCPSSRAGCCSRGLRRGSRCTRGRCRTSTSRPAARGLFLSRGQLDSLRD